CPQCRTELALRDNVPVISWLVLRGKCRTCQEPIPAGYPLVELANAILWVLAGLRFGPHVILLPYLVLFSVLLALSVIDLELYLLPNRITYPSIAASVVAIPLLSLLVHPHHVGTAILYAAMGGLGYSAFLLVVSVLFELVAKKNGMGMGDVKLALLIGLWLGWIYWELTLLSLIIASVLGLVAGAAVLIGRRGQSEAYPFGPWLALGCIIAILLSGPLLHFYEILQVYGVGV
ncbi:MAG TPA: prepilin peptidase, partial [Acidimicrobiales bacterium]